MHNEIRVSNVAKYTFYASRKNMQIDKFDGF